MVAELSKMVEVVSKAGSELPKFAQKFAPAAMMALLADAGIEPLEDLDKSRKLLFDTNLPDVKLVIIRATDVPTYVQLGAADLGIAGKDVLLEHGAAEVHAYISHGVLSGPAVERVTNSKLSSLVITDSIAELPASTQTKKVRQLSIAPLLGEAIRRIANDESVSKLFG